MPFVNKEEMLNKIRGILPDDTTDESLSLIGDISDTYDEYETKVKGNTDWKQKYEENDKNWREKYRDRFYNGNKNKDEEEVFENDEDQEVKIKSYSDLFTTESPK